MQKTLLVLLTILFLSGCATTNIKFEQNADSSYEDIIKNILIVVSSTRPETTYNVTVAQVTINFIELLEEHLVLGLEDRNINAYIFKQSGLELDQKSIIDIISDKEIDTILEINHIESESYGTLTLSHRYDTSLTIVNEQKKVWRAQINIGRSGFGAAGLNPESALKLSTEIIQELDNNNFL